MRGFKADLRKSDVIIIIGMILLPSLLLVVYALLVGGHQAAQPGQATGTIVTETAREGLIKLQRENERSVNAWIWNSGAAILSSLFSTLVIVSGALIAFWRWRGDQRTEQDKRAEERFQKVVEGLGSERTEAKVGAAITLRTFLLPGYERFYLQTFDLAVAHLRLRKAGASTLTPPNSPDHVLPNGDLWQEQQPVSSIISALLSTDSLSQALITAFKESFPLAREELKKANTQTDENFIYKKLNATNVQLDNAYLVEADLAEAWLVGASLRGAILSGAQLHLALLSFAQLEGAWLEGAQLQEAFLPHAQLQQAHLEEAQFQQARLRETQLQQAHLEKAQLQGAFLVDAQLQGADLSRANLTEAKLCRADLSGAKLIEADLSRADLRGDKMNNETDLTGTKLQGAKYNTEKVQPVIDRQGNPVRLELTQWPPGFDLSKRSELILDNNS